MDNEQERDTHFQGFAKLLYSELAEHTKRDFVQPLNTVAFMQAQYTIIAQRAYDLVKHATEHINKNAIYTEHPRFDAFMLAIVPDLTEWPESQ